MTDGPPKIKHTLLILGILMLLAGFIGVLGLRLGIIQPILGISDPYPGIGTAEPMGHVVSMVPFVLGLVTVAFWGIRNDPIYHELEKMKEEAGEGMAEEEMDFERPDSPEKEAPAQDAPLDGEGPTVQKERFEWEDEELPEPVISAKRAPELDAETSAASEEIFGSLDELEREAAAKRKKGPVKQTKAAPKTESELKATEEKCRKMLSFARVLDEDRERLELLIGTGITVHEFTDEVKKAVERRKKKEEEEARTAEQKAQIIEDEVLDELLSLEDEVGENEEDLEDLLLSDLEDLDKELNKKE